MICVSFSRIYTFSAAHRLHSDQLSEKENAAVYDKCNNLFGHGHDYFLEVSVTGEPDKQTGMIIPLPKLDHKVGTVLDALNYKHLDKEVSCFNSRPSTGEHIIQYLWENLKKEIGETFLYHLRLWETKNNYFEIEKE